MNLPMTSAERALESAGMGAWQIEVSTEQVHWSPLQAALFGMPAEVFDGTWDGALSHVHPEDRERVETDLRLAIATQSSIDHQYRVVWPDGSLHWISSRGSVVLHASELAECIRGVSWDCTEQKQASETLVERASHSALEAARVGTWEWNLADDRLTWSSRCLAIFGLENSATMSYEGFLAAIHPDDRPRVDQVVREALQNGSEYNTEMRAIWPDGSTHWVNSRGRAYYDAMGSPIRMSGVALDITREKEAEEKLRASEQLLSFVVESSGLGLWDYDLLSGEVRTSPILHSMLRLQPDQRVRFETVLAAVHPEDRPRFSEAVQDAIEWHHDYSFECRICSEDGVRWIHSLGRARYDAGGKPLRLSGITFDITDRREAEQALQASENEARARAAELSAILDAVPAITFIAHDAECRSMTSSRAAHELLRLPEGANSSKTAPEEERATHFRVLRDGEEIPAAELPVQRAARTGEAIRDAQFQIVFEDETSRDLFGHAVPLFDANGKSRGAVGAFVDVSAMKLFERELVESNARFRTLFESDLIGIVISERSGACLDGNDAFLRLVGYSREEMTQGKLRWRDITPSEHLERDEHGIAEVEERGACTPYEKDYIRKDGSRVSVLIGYTQLRGVPGQYIAFILDLSAQKRAEAVIRASEQQFRTLADGLPQLISVSNGDGIIEYCNEPFFRFTGIVPEETVGRPWSEVRHRLLHPADARQTLSKWTQSLGSGKEYQHESRLLRHDGVYRAYLTRSVPVRNDAGQIIRWVTSSTDVHDQKLSEEALRRSEKLAATGRLASSIAHEINNPLQAVTSLVYLMNQDCELSESSRRLLRTAENELMRMSHIVTQTLRFVRTSRLAVESDLSDIAESALSLFRTRLSGVGIQIEQEYQATSPIVCCADELRQVIAILISNAYDAMRNGGRLKMRIRNARRWSDESPAPGIRVTIADTGCGIDPDVRARLFEPFVTTKDATGTGLGMWVASEVIRRHGGTISFRSSTRAGKSGTVFSVFVPSGQP